MGAHSQYQRVAAYAVIVRSSDEGDEILLSRLAPQITPRELWTLPGGGIDFGEPPADSVVREVHEETGLDATVGLPVYVGSARRVVDGDVDLHSVRIVYAGRVPSDSPRPQVMEVDGSTIDAAWHRLDAVRSGQVPTVDWIGEAIAAYLEIR